MRGKMVDKVEDILAFIAGFFALLMVTGGLILAPIAIWTGGGRIGWLAIWAVVAGFIGMILAVVAWEEV